MAALAVEGMLADPDGSEGGPPVGARPDLRIAVPARVVRDAVRRYRHRREFGKA